MSCVTTSIFIDVRHCACFPRSICGATSTWHCNAVSWPRVTLHGPSRGLNAHVPLYGASSYAAAKAGVESFTKNSALELGADGIRVNAVLPGLVQTPMTSQLLAVDSIAQDFTDRIIMGRAGQPTEIADACLYLASDASSYITGTSLVVDGGWEITNYPDLSSVM